MGCKVVVVLVLLAVAITGSVAWYIYMEDVIKQDRPDKTLEMVDRPGLGPGILTAESEDDVEIALNMGFGGSKGGWAKGKITKNIDGHAIEIDHIRMRLPMIDVEDSGNPDAPHAVLARQICPVGTAAWYNLDDMQGKDAHGRTVATVFCYEGGHLDTAILNAGLGWVDQYWCHKSEFQYSDWVESYGGCQETNERQDPNS